MGYGTTHYDADYEYDQAVWTAYTEAIGAKLEQEGFTEYFDYSWEGETHCSGSNPYPNVPAWRDELLRDSRDLAEGPGRGEAVTDPATSVLADNADDLLRYFRRRVGDDAAPDLLAETLTTAWRRIRVLPDEPEAARAWLFRTANNVLLNHRRSERRQSRLADRVRTVLASTEQVAGADAGLEVRDAIDRLDPKLAEVVRLVHWEGFTIAQASVVLDIAASTARNHYAQAKQQLRAALKEPVLR